MKLLRMGTTPCVLDGDVVRDATSLAADFGPETLADALAQLAAADITALPEYAGDAAVSTPISQPRNIYCVGLNYSDHAAEAGMPIPEEPILFNKSSGTFCGPNDPILHHPAMTKLDWEVELAIVIGKTCFGVSEAEALDCVGGLTLANDVSERAWQIERGGQWMKGKSFPNFCPTGPWLVTLDEIGDPQNLDMWLDVNGTRKQTGTTAKMIFNVAEIVSHMSQFMRLEAGDLICTGTPPGVGMGQNPPEYLSPGDVVELGIQGLGQQRQVVTSI